MTALRSIALILLISTAAYADTITGEVDMIREVKVFAERDSDTVQVALIKASGGKTYRITGKDVVDTLFWLEREQVVLEGTISEGTAPEGSLGAGSEDFTVAKIVEPQFETNMKGVAWSNKPGLSGRRRIVMAGGREVKDSGPCAMAIYSLTKDLKKHLLTFSAFKLKGTDGAIKELVVMEIEAKAKKEFILSEPALYTLFKIIVTPLLFADPPEIRAEIETGEAVHIVRRSMWGGSLKVRNHEHVSGFTSWDNLEIGTIVADDFVIPVEDTIQADITKRMDEAVPHSGAIKGLDLDQ